MDPTAWDAQDDLRRLHSNSGEPAMADGEASTATNIGTAFRTVPIETKRVEMNYRRS